MTQKDSMRRAILFFEGEIAKGNALLKKPDLSDEHRTAIIQAVKEYEEDLQNLMITLVEMNDANY